MFLSVITVTFNCVNTIENTILSVLQQKNDDIEYIIIDGGSTDGTINIIKKYEKKITYWISESDNGIYDAMNKGIKLSSGEWVSFLNGNDWYEKGIFEVVRNAVKSNEYSIIYGWVNAIENGVKNGYVGISNEVHNEELHFQNLYCHQGLFINQCLFKVLGYYDTNFKIYADYDWILRAHRLGYEPYLLNVTIANFTLGGVSQSIIESDEELEIIIKNYRGHKKFPRFLEKRRGKAEYIILKRKNPNILKIFFSKYREIYIWGLGKYGMECYKMLRGIEIEIKGIILSKPNIKMWYGIPVYSYIDLFNMNGFIENIHSGILVATEEYEDEILGILNKNSISEEKYVRMSQLYKWSYENFPENYNG